MRSPLQALSLVLSVCTCVCVLHKALTTWCRQEGRSRSVVPTGTWVILIQDKGKYFLVHHFHPFSQGFCLLFYAPHHSFISFCWSKRTGGCYERRQMLSNTSNNLKNNKKKFVITNTSDRVSTSCEFVTSIFACGPRRFLETVRHWSTSRRWVCWGVQNTSHLPL